MLSQYKNVDNIKYINYQYLITKFILKTCEIKLKKLKMVPTASSELFLRQFIKINLQLISCNKKLNHYVGSRSGNFQCSSEAASNINS